MYAVLKSFGSVILVCECYESVYKYGSSLKNCGNVIIFGEYNENVVDV